MSYRAWPHPWLCIERLIRSILEVRWDREGGCPAGC